MSDTRGGSELPSGRFVLRIDPQLHASLRQAAKRAGVSLNEHCSRKLAAPDRGLGGPAAEVVERAASLFGQALAGVVVFGSWARGEAAEDSDVDVLLVLDAAVELTRVLYDDWDERPLRWQGHAVEPHFVRLPAPADRATGLWLEAALDGVVLLDPELAVSRRLVEIRRWIVDGEIVRRETHGQPYWVVAA